MLILTQDARERIAAAVAQSLQAPVLAITADGVRQCSVEIGEYPIVETTPDGVRLGVWINITPATVDAIVAGKARWPTFPGAWDGVTPVDAERFEDAPCYLCGYSGPGYYQTGTHPCAAGYHAAVARLSRVDPA